MLRRHHAWLGVGLLLVVPSLLIAQQARATRDQKHAPDHTHDAQSA